MMKLCVGVLALIAIISINAQTFVVQSEFIYACVGGSILMVFRKIQGPKDWSPWTVDATDRAALSRSKNLHQWVDRHSLSTY